MLKGIQCFLICNVLFLFANAQKSTHIDSIKTLQEVTVAGYKTVNGVGH